MFVLLPELLLETEVLAAGVFNPIERGGVGGEAIEILLVHTVPFSGQIVSAKLRVAKHI